MLNDRLYRSAPPSQQEIDQTNAIRNEISRHIELFSPPLLGGKRTDTAFYACARYSQRVTMDIYSGFATHAAVLLVRWVTISHLIYELNGHSMACFLTCNNVTTAKQLRKMRENGREACHRSCTALHCTSDVLSEFLCMDELIPAIFMYLMQQGKGWKKRYAYGGFIEFKLPEIQMQGIR